jgi:choline dehydrogenase-like flavoprotein
LTGITGTRIDAPQAPTHDPRHPVPDRAPLHPHARRRPLMFHDARQLPPDTVLDGDLVIIGAGPAGITIARELIGTQLKVILLEGGGLEMDHDSQSLYEGENIGHPYLPLQALRSRYFGGSSNCWGGWCRPFDAIDFEKRDWVPHSGWPFGKSEMEPYYERAQVLCSLGPDNYGLDFWEKRLDDPKLKLIRMPDDRVVSRIAQLSQSSRFGIAYGHELEAAANIHVYFHANVLEIEADATAKTVTGLRAATFAGTRFRAAGKHYVLSTGGIENARTLLLSNRVATTGLGNQHDLVGRFFMEHPRVHIGEVVPDDPKTPLDLYDVQYTFFHAPAAAHLALREEVLREERLLNYKGWILAVYKGEQSKGGEALKNLYRAAKKTTLPDHFMDTTPSFWLRNFGTALIDFPNTASVALGRLTKSPWFVKKREFAHLCEPAPNPDSRITLGPDKDRFGLNRVRLDWRLTQLDKHTIRRAQQIIAEEFVRAGFGRVEGDILDDRDNVWPDKLLWGWHQMGTTRMHDDPKQGVVDANCRVHGMSNLYVAGSSVFPTGGSDLPTMTIVALALRLAGHLRGVFKA